jgi:hypothetical protein
LRGVLHGDETGLFVSFSGFTPEAVRQAQGEKPIRLVDRDDFIALWTRHHDALPDAARDMLRLKAVHFLDHGTVGLQSGFFLAPNRSPLRLKML